MIHPTDFIIQNSRLCPRDIMASTETSQAPASERDDRIVVIGAGVIGLTVANALRDRFPHRPVTIVASEIPTSKAQLSASYASAWAGAHYRPVFPSTPQLKDEFELALRTYETMKVLAEDMPRSGVELMQGVEYLNQPAEEVVSGLKNGDVYASPEDGFRILKEDELVEGTKWGCEYLTYCVNPAVYAAFLTESFTFKGGIMVERTIKEAREVFDTDGLDLGGNVRVVVNCSGTNFGQDPKMKIIRGQTCLVKNKYHRTMTRQYADGRWTTIIPRPHNGGTIVGVSKEIDDDNVKARPETRKLLLEQCIESFPEFVTKVQDFEVVCDNVGRRPFREGGTRIEVEHLSERQCIVHAYGSGGRGYELSWGIANEVAQLVHTNGL